MIKPKRSPRASRSPSFERQTMRAIVASLMALVNPGEKVIVFEPFYENYLPGLTLCGGIPLFIRLRDPYWTLDPDELKKAFSQRPKAVILNTPANPSGKVFSRQETEMVARFCQEAGTYVITDEIYEHILYDGLQHTHMASLPGMWERTVTISGISKTYSATGWRVGYVIAHSGLMSAIRKCHDYMVVAAPTPFQMGAVVAMGLPDSYYGEIQQFYRERRDFLLKVFEDLSVPVFAFWTTFLRSLVKRGLRGGRLVISDAHEGLKAANGRVLTGATWQRCRVHFMRNLLATLRQVAREPIAAIVRTIFAQPDHATALAQLHKVADGLRSRFPATAALLEDAAEDVLAYRHLPVAHQRQLHSTNPLERLNKEIKRRSNVVGIFPNARAVIRLVGAILLEQDDEWAVADWRYFRRRA